MYSYQVEQAIKAACVLHQDQLRKGLVQIPYISHLMAVTFIVRDYTPDENTLVAALLHDTLEDSDYTAEEMTNDFGKDVADIVQSVTEPKYQGDVKLSWREKKDAYVQKLKSAREEALIVAAADKIHNFRSMVEEYHADIERFKRDFGSHGDQRLEFYQAVSNVLNSRLKNAIVHEFNHTFKEYKEFYRHAEDSQGKK
jgi:(p)ppGpp synthase/HD superfamily hydrolase